MSVEDATTSFKRPRFRSPRCYSFGEKNSRLLLVRSGRKKCGRRGRDVSFPMIKRTRRALSNDQCPVLLGAIVSEKKIVKEKCFFPLFSLNCYSSAPIGPIWTKKMWSGRDEPFKRSRSGSPRCYSFGEKNS
ncbi:hypothetical protein V1477_006329 [Vespula maculifrons]|uniref:Uncharacterized protein n=1 Tax=Vespula maculifrons TaxID=7453 RepID=A0ABD2CKY7_VESMC